MQVDFQAIMSVCDLGALEARELQQMLQKGGDVSVKESHSLTPNQQGDAALFDLIVTATPWVIGVIGLWLLKPRRGKTVKTRLTRTDVHGEVHEAEIYIHEYASETPSDTVVNALAKLFGFDTTIIKKAIHDVSAADTEP